MLQLLILLRVFFLNKSIFIWYFRWNSRFHSYNGSRTTDRELLNLWKHRHAFVYSQEIPVELFAVAKGHYIRHRLVRFLIKDDYPAMYKYSVLYQYINYRLIKRIFFILFILDVYSLETTNATNFYLCIVKSVFSYTTVYRAISVQLIEMLFPSFPKRLQFVLLHSSLPERTELCVAMKKAGKLRKNMLRRCWLSIFRDFPSLIVLSFWFTSLAIALYSSQNYLRIGFIRRLSRGERQQFYYPELSLYLLPLNYEKLFYEHNIVVHY